MAAENSAPRPKMTLGGEFDDGYGEFLGVVAIDTWEHGENGWKWHLGVKPTDIEIKGDTGCFHTWAKASSKENSVMGVQRKAMMVIFPGDLELGEGNLLGTGAWWKRETIKFGVNSQTGEEMKAEGVLVPLRLAAPEEQERINQKGGTGPTPIVAPVAAATTLSDEDLEAVLAFIDGKTAEEITRSATSRECKFERTIKQGLISGTLLEQLQDRLIVSDGVYNVIPF